MTEPLLHTWNLNLGYAKRLVADIPEAQMAVQPAAGMNHAAWVLGHLACTADMLGAIRGFLPTLGDCFVFVMAAHENMHLGQLSAWRRVQGLGRV
jgi:hypothetical protein